MDVMCFIYIYEDINEDTIENADKWCRHLITKFGTNFNTMRIDYGGNAVTAGMTYRRSLDEEFLEDGLARIAWMVYEEEIHNHTYSNNDSLVEAYFKNTTNVQGLFSRLYQV